MAMDTVTSKVVVVVSRELLRESFFPPLPLKWRGFQKGTCVTKKMPGYLWLPSAFLCMIMFTACAANSSSNGEAQAAVKSKPTATKVSLAAMPKVVVIAGHAKPPVKPRPTQVFVPPPMPTKPPIVIPTSPSSGMTGTTPSVPAAAQAVLTLINRERASVGLAALTWNAGLQRSAHQHDVTMQAANVLSHQLPGEAAFGDRERAAGVNWMSAGENIGWGQGNPTATAVSLNQSMFNERPPDDGHRQNILSTSSNVVGIDVLVDRAHNKVWLTEDFAQI